ncbi:MAG: hypothetical protein QOC71_2065, partial [Thermoplasmata archaeon]|nr:hypothetical protein [Thermoplasmata archaeon]
MSPVDDLRVPVALIAFLALLAPLPSAVAAGNTGSIKVLDEVGGGSGNDAHVDCADFWIAGQGMADGLGTLTFYSWPPTGDKAIVLKTTWTGTAADKGFDFLAGPFTFDPGHYRVEADDDDGHGGAKKKTFWVEECAPGTSTSSSSSPPACPTGDARLASHSFMVDGAGPYPNLDGHVQPGDVVDVDFTIAAGCNDIELSLVSYEAPSATFSRETADQQILFDWETGLFDAGHHAMRVDVPGCFFQVDFVFGPVIEHLGPADSHNFYGDQGRLIEGENGGTTSCVPPPPPPPQCPAGAARMTSLSYRLNGDTPVGDLGGNVHAGDLVRVDFTIAAPCQDIQLSLVSYMAPGPTFDADTAHLQVVHDSDTGFFDAGDHSMDVTIPPCFFQVDFVFGPVIEHLGPAGTDNFYGAQGRLIDGDNGGVSCPPPPPPALACPTFVAATGLDVGSILVQWTPPAGATGVKVYRDGAPVVMLDDAITSYTDAGLTPGQTYTYMVTSHNGPTETQGCPTVAATAPSPPPPVPLECPYNVTATEQPDGSILMRFTPPAPVDGLRVFRAASPLRLVATLPADATSYLDTNTTPGHLYRYMVVSFRAGEQSLDCSDVEITTQAA